MKPSNLPIFNFAFALDASLSWSGEQWPGREVATLVVPAGGINRAIYTDMVRKERLGKNSKELKRRIWIPVKVVEGNAPIHNSKVANSMRDKLRIDRLTHLPSSPDLNPIKNLWAIVRNSVARRFPQATNTEQLFEHVQQAWEEIPMETVNRVIDTMETRRQAVIASRRLQTRY